ncbi:MAG: UDP-N-acetylmuramate dehydrogenase [Pedosphaera sp.]|nr:UDP-N-acetylmuramate dehydrogenase [Pedosphaera sp.]
MNSLGFQPALTAEGAVKNSLNEQDSVVVSTCFSGGTDRPLCRETGLAAALRAALSRESIVREREPLACRNTLRVGGAADVWLEPAHETDLAAALQTAYLCSQPVFLLGRGSNLLVRDGGIAGLVVCLSHATFSGITIEKERLRCSAGARLKDVANAARRAGLRGFEFLVGIPGSVGGALRMNAGAMGGWMFQSVEWVRVMELDGRILDLLSSEIPTEYRSCPRLGTAIALAAGLRGEPGDPDAIKACMERNNARRWESQPSQPSAGCIFKNPSPELSAGRLLDDLGLKGLKRGRAMVSDIHANFIVNLGGASAGDVLGLIEEIRERVRAARGIELHTEVEIVGRD